MKIKNDFVMIKIVTKSQDRFRQAVEIAVQAYQGQVDWNGVPYIRRKCLCIARPEE